MHLCIRRLSNRPGQASHQSRNRASATSEKKLRKSKHFLTSAQASKMEQAPFSFQSWRIISIRGKVGAKSVRLPLDSRTCPQVAIASQSSRFDRARKKVLPHGSFARLPVRTGTAIALFSFHSLEGRGVGIPTRQTSFENQTLSFFLFVLHSNQSEKTFSFFRFAMPSFFYHPSWLGPVVPTSPLPSLSPYQKAMGHFSQAPSDSALPVLPRSIDRLL